MTNLRARSTGTPTELAITIAAAAASGWNHREGWVPADIVRGKLERLGFDCTTQQVAAWLKRMAATDAPWIERRRDPWDYSWEYRVTRFGANDVDNQLEGVRLLTPWIPTLRRTT